jgi:hypothetical protein
VQIPIYNGSAVCPKCQINMSSGFNPGGEGKCNRRLAKRSGGLSKVTVGTPKVRPIKLANAPPRLCPVSQIVEFGYASVTL